MRPHRLPCLSATVLLAAALALPAAVGTAGPAGGGVCIDPDSNPPVHVGPCSVRAASVPATPVCFDPNHNPPVYHDPNGCT